MKFKHCLTLLTIAMTAATSHGIPAKPGVRLMQQPDGTTIRVRVAGDEYDRYLTTEDGVPLKRDADGFYRPDESGRREKAERRLAPQTGLGMSSTTYPTTGSPKVPVVLVEFADVRFSDDYDPAAYFREMVTGEDFKEYGANGSAAQYFRDQSGGKFTPQFDVMGPITLPYDLAYYGDNRGQGWDVFANKMVSDAVTILDQTVNFKDYDEDGDGEVDMIYIFYAGYSEAETGNETDIWPHAGKIKQDANFKLADGKWINSYACSNELSANREPTGIGAFVHEFSHILGLPDIYPTERDDNWDYTSGQYCVLDYGCYNNNSHTPPNYGAYERNALGWDEPIMLTEPMDMTLKDISTGQFGLIPTDNINEFFLLENRQLEGWDAYIPNHGLLIHHIDYDEKAFNNNAVNNKRAHPRVDLVEANNMPGFAQNAEGFTFPGTTGKTEFTAETTPALRTWADEPIDLPITVIRENEDGTLAFKVAGGGQTTGVETITGASEETPAYFNLQGMRLDNPAHGSIVIERRGNKSKKIIFRKRP